MSEFRPEDLNGDGINTARVKMPGEKYAYVREMTSWEKDTRIDEWWRTRKEARKQGEGDETGRTAWVAAASWCYEDGKWMAETNIAVNELCDKLLQGKSLVVSLLVQATAELNGIGKAEVERIEKK